MQITLTRKELTDIKAKAIQEWIDEFLVTDTVKGANDKKEYNILVEKPMTGDPLSHGLIAVRQSDSAAKIREIAERL